MRYQGTVEERSLFDLHTGSGREGGSRRELCSSMCAANYQMGGGAHTRAIRQPLLSA